MAHRQYPTSFTSISLFILALLFSLAAWGSDPVFEWNGNADDFLESLVDDRAQLLFDSESAQILEAAEPLLKKARSIKGPQYYEGGKKEAADIKKEAASKILEFFEQSPDTIRVDLESDPKPLKTVGPIRLVGDKDCLVLRIESGTSEIQLVHRDFPMGLEGDEGDVSVKVSSTGITWMILDITEAPKGKTYFVLSFERADRDPVRMPVLVETPPHSRLTVTVVDEESGEETPFMVSLRWGEDNSPRRPPNAVDLTSQFERNGQPASLRKARLPGNLDGEYWCVPGPFDMTLPPGEWNLILRKGLEYVPVMETLKIEPGETAHKIYKMHRWAKMSEKGWVSGDDHVHLRMTSDAEAKVALTWAKAEGIRVSNILEMGDIAGTHFYQRGFGKEYRVEEEGYWLVPGEEDPRTHHELGHTIRLNNQSFLRFPEKYFLYDLYYDTVRDQGGLSGFAHVNSGIFHIQRSLTLNLPKGKCDFVEVFQFEELGTHLFYEFLNLGFPMTLSAGSDVPWGGTIGEQRVYVYLGDRPFTPDAWFEEFGKGRTFVTNGPMLEFTVNEALPGDTLNFSGTGEFQVKAQALGGPGRFLPSRLDLLRQGETIASVTNTEGSASALELDFDLEESESVWLAVRALGDDGSVAHTTPIYLVRDSKRFWKRDQVPNLLEKRMQDLDEIEELIQQATEKIDQGINLLDTERSEQAALSAQVLKETAPDLMSQVKEAREFYSGLREVYEEGLR